MDRYDYKSINVPKGAEADFNRVFAAFGYGVSTTQEVYLSAESSGNSDMDHYYLPGEEDDALLGLVLHRAETPVGGYFHIVYERDRFDSHFRAWADAEHIYNRMTYDRYRLSLDIAKHKKRKHLPKAVNIIAWILLILGVIALLLGVWKKGMDRPISSVFSGSKSALAFYGGAAAIIFVLAVWLFSFVIFRTIADGRLKHSLIAYDDITIMKNRFRAAFRHGKTVPEIDLKTLEEIEKAHKLNADRR